MKPRATAIRSSVADIINGRFTKEDGSHVVSTHGVKLRRVVLVGYIVRHYSKPNEYASVTIDDGTETIRAKAWKATAQVLSQVELNKLVMMMGRVREYKDEVYIDPEFVREIVDPNLMTLHLLERLRSILFLSSPTAAHAPVEAAPSRDTAVEAEEPGPTEEETEKASPRPLDSLQLSGPITSQIVQFIEQRGGGAGVRINEIVDFFEGRGHDSDEISVKVIDLQDSGKIREIDVGIYLAAKR